MDVVRGIESREAPWTAFDFVLKTNGPVLASRFLPENNDVLAW